MVIEEHARLEILLPNETEWRYISEKDIIQNSLSIASKCMDDGSFMLGGVFSAQLSAKFRISDKNVNSYTVIGAKIKVYSWYGHDRSKEKLRGIFWVTSASRNSDIYTISASDALIWFDSTSYEDGEQGESVNKIYELLKTERDITDNLEVIINLVRKVVGEDKEIAYRPDKHMVNSKPNNRGYMLLPSEKVGEISTRNPRDYISWLAELACGFAFVNYDEGDAWIKIGQFWEDAFIEILSEETELNSCEISDFTLKFNRVYAKIYNGHYGSKYSSQPTAGGIIIDISDNPFKDGHWECHDGNAMDVIGNIYEKLTVNRINFRPFKLKCHKNDFFEIEQDIKPFELGQKVKLPNGEFSLLTGIKWQFRGGYTLSCAGRDTRILSVAAKRSQAAKVRDMAFTKINTEKSDVLKRLENSKNDLQGQISSKSDEISSLGSRINNLENSDFQGHINELRNRIEALENGG